MPKNFAVKAKRYAAGCLCIISMAILCTNIKTKQNSVSVLSKSNTQQSAPASCVKQNFSNTVGVWIPYNELEIKDCSDTEKAFKENFDKIISTAKNHNVNTLIVHIRSHCDAMYKSDIFPWSHVISGVQGKDLGFDPLEYMIKTAHENQMSFHAWINPLRVKTNSVPSEMSKSNPYYTLGDEKYFIYHSGGICLNPAYKTVRELVVNGISEIVSNYDVDAIHFDDYFYPEDCSDYAYDNRAEIAPECASMEVSEWRKQNINTLIKETYDKIKSIKSGVSFGISPPGNPNKCDKIGADIKTWMSKSGYIDYICPQIYWSTDFSVMPFESTAKKWCEFQKNDDIALFAGLALYKAGSDLDNGTWKSRNDILSNEAALSKSMGFDGIMMFAARHLSDSNTADEIANMDKAIKNHYN